MFRGLVSSRPLRNFEDTVIFVLDIEKCLLQLDRFSRDIVARIALQEYSQGETAALIGQPLRTVIRKYAEALDTLTEIFLENELLNLNCRKPCQGAVNR
jgi:DNA-directed RNA polymerase specialized sigma24 family protein